MSEPPFLLLSQTQHLTTRFIPALETLNGVTACRGSPCCGLGVRYQFLSYLRSCYDGSFRVSSGRYYEAGLVVDLGEDANIGREFVSRTPWFYLGSCFLMRHRKSMAKWIGYRRIGAPLALRP